MRIKQVDRGYYELIIAVIKKALEDLLTQQPSHYYSAVKFFKSPLFLEYCDLVNLNPDYIKRKFKIIFKEKRPNGRCPI